MAGLEWLTDRIGYPESPFSIMDGIRAKSATRPKKSGYREYFDDETRRIIEVQHAREIQLFNYSF